MGHRRKVILFVVIGLVAGLVYPIFGDKHDTYLPLLNGISTGVIGAVLIALIEVFYFDRQSKNSGFLFTLFFKSILYTNVLGILVVAIKGVNESLYHQIGFWSYVKGERFQHFLFHEDLELILLYSLAVIGFVIFVNQLSKRMGSGVLWNLISGKYHKPRKENIILMNMDLKSSTVIMEDIGAEKYLHFINQFYRDISDAIISSKCLVYRYVGDQITFYWIGGDELGKANCFEFYKDVKELVTGRTQNYIDEFGYVPEFRASCHMGELVVGQVGDVKSQIVFHGEAMYTCYLIEKKCKELDRDFLVSSEVLDKIGGSSAMRFFEIGSLGLSHSPDCQIYALES